MIKILGTWQTALILNVFQVLQTIKNQPNTFLQNFRLKKNNFLFNSIVAFQQAWVPPHLMLSLNDISISYLFLVHGFDGPSTTRCSVGGFLNNAKASLTKNFSKFVDVLYLSFVLNSCMWNSSSGGRSVFSRILRHDSRPPNTNPTLFFHGVRMLCLEVDMKIKSSCNDNRIRFSAYCPRNHSLWFITNA